MTLSETVTQSLDAMATGINEDLQRVGWSSTVVTIKLALGAIQMIGYVATAVDNVAQAIRHHADRSSR